LFSLQTDKNLNLLNAFLLLRHDSTFFQFHTFYQYFILQLEDVTLTKHSANPSFFSLCCDKTKYYFPSLLWRIYGTDFCFLFKKTFIKTWL